MKKVLAFFLASFLFSQSASAQVYIGLGDSLAAGQTPYSEIDAGYTDFIALGLARAGQLDYFSKSLAFPGYTVGDVLARVEKDGEILKRATLITISAGANDLLPLVRHNPDTGTVQFSQLAADFALNQARGQMVELLAAVRERAPQADIYVMGYYFPYTSVHEEQRAGVAAQLDVLNAILKQAAQEAGATFVPVTFTNGTKLLPNVGDVHPNQIGYMEMANAFLRVYGVPTLTAAQLPKPNPHSFQQLLQQMNVQAEPVEEQPKPKREQQYHFEVIQKNSYLLGH